MPAIIYEKTANGLYPTGKRTVTTFPSGLVRVDQTFSCKTSAASIHRADLAMFNDMPGSVGSFLPSVVTPKIFPTAQEEIWDDGFTEFKVSAYGYADISFPTSSETYYFEESGTANIGTEEEPDIENFKRVFRAYRYTKNGVVQVNAEIADPNNTTPILLSGPAYSYGGQYPPYQYTKKIDVFRKNFGAYDEYIITSYYG